MIKELKKAILDALFPEKAACFSCGREAVTDGDGFCADCRSGLEVFNAAEPPKFVDGYTAAYVYNDVSSRMIKRLKYNNARYLAKPLADALMIPDHWKIDAVLPVPLYYRREMKRGYNQSELIAKELCERTGAELNAGLLVRTRNTGQQTRLTEAGRKRNVKDAFAADESAKGLSILLVDDVRTTGATLSECAKELKKYGADRVYAITVCCAFEQNNR